MAYTLNETANKYVHYDGLKLYTDKINNVISNTTTDLLNQIADIINRLESTEDKVEKIKEELNVRKNQTITQTTINEFDVFDEILKRNTVLL